MKLILILLANKADEGFSSLMPEFGTGRSTVLRALNDLETRGFLTRQPQFHERVAQRSSRSYLNHPDAPDLSSRPDAGLPVPIETAPSANVAHDFDRCIDQVDECGRRREITMAVVDVWLQLLPELHTDDGMQLLKKHANDSI